MCKCLCRKTLYSSMVALLLASVTFPESVGQYMASQVGKKELWIFQLFGLTGRNILKCYSFKILSFFNHSTLFPHIKTTKAIFQTNYLMQIFCENPPPRKAILQINDLLFVIRDWGWAIWKQHGESRADWLTAAILKEQLWGFALAVNLIVHKLMKTLREAHGEFPGAIFKVIAYKIKQTWKRNQNLIFLVIIMSQQWQYC